MKKRSKLVASILASLFLVASIAGPAMAKSLYVIADINAYRNIPIQAYDIQGTNLVYQYTGYIPDRDGGAVGLTIDTDSAYLFVTFEFSGTLDMVDGTTMTRVGQVVAPGASNLAGIVVDQGKRKVYAVDRRTNHLYVYAWDPSVPSLTLEGGTYKTLTNASAWGIALDETTGLLYVANGNSIIRYYDTANWTEQGSFTASSRPIGLAVDTAKKFVYSGGWNTTTLSKYNLNTDTETNVTTNAYPIGFAVDPQTSLLYVTYFSYDRLRVFDSDLNSYWTSGDLGNPTGLCVPGKEVSYNPLNLIKTDNPDPVVSLDDLTYTLCFDNLANELAVSNVTITDDVPGMTSFVSATGPYSIDGTTVTWDFGNVPANDPGQCVDLVVNVQALPDIILTNTARIDSDDTPPTTVNENTDVIADMPICGDLDDDGDVDSDDRGIFLGALRTCTGDPDFVAEADYDDDGCISFSDYRLWYGCYKAYMNSMT